jgi:uncharacterized glyoxalase superfamily protein PhnB
MAIIQAIPLLRVTDVARSMAWYQSVLGFAADPFPQAPPHEFAVLSQGNVEVMLRHGTPTARALRQYDWDVYLRREGDDIRAVFAAFEVAGIVTRRLERMPYGLVEFEVRDPDGYLLCLSQALADGDDLPTPAG